MRVTRHTLSLMTILVFCSAETAVGATVNEILQRMPGPPAAPTSREECTAFKKPYDDLIAQINKAHQECLDAHSGSGVDSGGGPCSYAPCEQYHSPYTQPWYREVQRAFQVCSEQARYAEAQQREFLDQQRAQLEAQAQYQREYSQRVYDAAREQANREAARLDQKRDAAAGRASYFEGALARNQALLGSAGTSASTGTLSVNAALGGSLGSTLGSLREMLGASSSSGHGSGPDLISLTPSSANLERGSLVAKYLADWPGTASVLSAASGAVGLAERATDVWSTWSAFRSGDVGNGAGGAAALAADLILPTHSAFFAVPAIKTVTAVHGAALGELDRAFQEFDQQTSAGQPYIPPPPPQEYTGNFQPVQQAYIESMCDYCAWDEERGTYKVSVLNELVEIRANGEIGTGWTSIQRVLGSP